MNVRGAGSIWGQRSLQATTGTVRNRDQHLRAMPLLRAPIERYSGLSRPKEALAVTPVRWELPKWSSMRVLIIIGFALFCCLPSRASTITAATCSQTDVQAAINSASNGDTVKTPGPCTASWSNVTITGSVGITLDGGGNTTITSAAALTIRSTATTSTRVTGFIFTNGGNSNNGDVTTSGSKTGATFRIDHNTFTNANPTVIACWNNAPGLIDHNTFTGGGASEMIHNMAMGATDASGWGDDIMPGGPNMLFVEDNTFTNSVSNGGFLGTSAIQSYNGARTVFRHNTLTNAQIDQHGTAGMIGARWWEIYENTFVVANGVAQDKYMDIRAGGGVVFNNHKTGQASPAAIIFREEDTGYPALYQVGRGINQDYSPAFVWGNDSIMPVASNSSNVTQGVDFIVSVSQPPLLVRCELSVDSGVAGGLIGTCATSFSYIPFTYPHPLQGASSVAAPTGLAAVIH